MHCAVDELTPEMCKIWYSTERSKYRWTLHIDSSEDGAFSGDADSLEQAMRDIEHCFGLFKTREERIPT